MTKSKCILDKYTNYKGMKIINSSGIFNNKTICHNSSYFLLFGKRELQSFEISSK